MRKVLMGLLLAGAALAPAVANAQDDNGDGRRGHVRGEARGMEGRGGGDRQQRQEARQEQRAARQEARQQQVQSAPAPAQQQQVAQRGEGRRGGDGNRGGWRGNRGNDGGQTGQTSSGYQRGWQGPAGTENSDIARRYNRRAQENAIRYGTPDQRRDARQDRRADRRDDGRNWQGRGDGRRDWNRGWRNDRRYAWQDWRYQNRNLFRLSPYYSPYRNYGYQRFGIGFFLDRLFFDQRYWLNDPYSYRLPPAEYGTEWVRYYNDVLLVDIYTGEVLDVIHDFFW